jgi:hypothetical protein
MMFFIVQAKKAAMGSDSGDAPFNNISLFNFYYALDDAIAL